MPPILSLSLILNRLMAVFAAGQLTERGIFKLIFSHQNCRRKHLHRSNAINKNENQVSFRLFKRKKWSPCMPEVKHDIQVFSLSFKSCSSCWRDWKNYSKFSGWYVANPESFEKLTPLSLLGASYPSGNSFFVRLGLDVIITCQWVVMVQFFSYWLRYSPFRWLLFKYHGIPSHADDIILYRIWCL